MTRRQLLYGLAAAGGAGAAFGALEALDLAGVTRKEPFVPPRRSDFMLGGERVGKRVLILGAGVAGLASAYELEKAGYTCEILEARDRPGGRNWTVRGGANGADVDGNAQTARFRDGHYLNAGPARIAQHHTTLEYCRELGVPVEVFTNANPNAFYYEQEDPVVSGPLAGRPLRQREAKADTYGYLGELLAKCVNRGSLDDELSAEDRERLVDFLRQLGALAEGDRYLGSPRRRGRAVDRPLPLDDLLGAALGRYFAFELDWDQAAPMFQPVGGMDMLPRAFAEAIRGRIRYRADVRDIRTTPESVDVVYRDDDGEHWRVTGDYCICTIPPPVLREIASNFEPDVVSAVRDAFGVPAGRIGLEYRRRFWEEDSRIFGGITHTNLDIEVIFYPSYGYLGDGGVLNGYYNHFDNAVAYGELEPKEREARALEHGVRIHGEAYRSELLSSFSVEWSRERHSLGAWSVWDPERARSFAARLAEGDRNLWFAGDHVSNAVGWQHGALESARAAVTRLHSRAVSA